jgi:hypothetical protein
MTTKKVKKRDPEPKPKPKSKLVKSPASARTSAPKETPLTTFLRKGYVERVRDSLRKRGDEIDLLTNEVFLFALQQIADEVASEIEAIHMEMEEAE